MESSDAIFYKKAMVLHFHNILSFISIENNIKYLTRQVIIFSYLPKKDIESQNNVEILAFVHNNIRRFFSNVIYVISIFIF